MSESAGGIYLHTCLIPRLCYDTMFYRIGIQYVDVFSNNLSYVKYALKTKEQTVSWRTAIMKFHHFSRAAEDNYPLVLLRGEAR